MRTKKWISFLILIATCCFIISGVVLGSFIAPAKPNTQENQGFNSPLVSSPVKLATPVVANSDKDSADKLKFAPLSDEWQAWIQAGSPKNKNGYIPSIIKIPAYNGVIKDGKGAVKAYPASYDLRTLGKVSSVKDQGPCGSCWAQATMASLEGYFLPTASYDFSENSLKNDHSFDWGPCAGGNIYLSTSTFARWTGPFLESEDPYYPGKPFVTAGKGAKNVQNVYFVPTSSTQPNPNLKEFIMKYGPVLVAYYVADSASYYNSTTAAYYYPSTGAATSTNHEVAVIGWNDAYSKNNFGAYKPAGNGAWLVKNSWGTSFGLSGYFWVSYYDKFFGKEEMAMFTAEGVNNYARQYMYDVLGWVNSAGFSSPTGWGAEVFTAQAQETIKAVSSYFPVKNTQYTIEIWKGVTSTTNPRSGTKIITKSGTITWPGYQTIRFDSPQAVSKGQKFSVVIKYVTPGTNYPIPLELYISGFSSKVKNAGTGKSFISGNGGTWSDLSLGSYIPYKTDVALKAFT